MNEIITQDNQLAAKFKSELLEVELLKKELNRREEEMRNAIFDAMEEHGITQIKNDDMTISIKKESRSWVLDTERLKIEKPDIYLDYVKEKKTAKCLQIKLNGK